MRTFNSHGDWSNRWIVEPWPEAFKGNDGRTVACIEASEANIQALEAFAKRIRELRKHLADFVAPDRIEETLRVIAQGQGLLAIGGPQD